jgi:hypothetical protein
MNGDPESAPTAQQLRARYGMAKMLTTAQAGDALRFLGKRHEVHPIDVIAFLYASQEACDAFADGNLRHNGSPDLGSYPTGEGVIGICDLRPQFAEFGVAPTDPAKPDDAYESGRNGR